MIELERLRPQVEEILHGNQWVQWLHVQKGFTHCEDCLKLHECCFVKNKAPLVGEDNHPHCHCYYKSIPQITATAEASIAKFAGYIFNPEYDDGKLEMFLSWGYSIDDSLYLKTEFERQAKQKYESGDYRLGLLNKYGQRINIRIELFNRVTGQKISFKSGWLVEANGRISLVTPYGGK